MVFYCIFNNRACKLEIIRIGYYIRHTPISGLAVNSLINNLMNNSKCKINKIFYNKERFLFNFITLPFIPVFLLYVLFTGYIIFVG